MKNLSFPFLFYCHCIQWHRIKNIIKEKFHFDNSNKKDTSAGFAQAVKIDNVLHLSGAVATDVTPGGITHLFTTLQKTLEYYGAGFQNMLQYF